MAPFDEFCKKYHIIHNKTSVNNPESNGLAESGVHTAKILLRKIENDQLSFDDALAAQRNMPRADGYSPFQLFFNRQGRLPNLPRLPAQFDRYEGVAKRDETQLKQGQHFLMHARDYQKFKPGDEVAFPDVHGRWTRQGIIKQIRPGGLSYLVKDGDRLYLRGRRYLRPARPAGPPFGPASLSEPLPMPDQDASRRDTDPPSRSV